MHQKMLFLQDFYFRVLLLALSFDHIYFRHRQDDKVSIVQIRINVAEFTLRKADVRIGFDAVIKH